MRSIVALILLGAAPVVCGQTAGQDARSALKIIEDCSGSVSEDVYGLTDLESKCPGLRNALEQSGYLPLLSSATRETLHAYDLTDLLQVDDWYQGEQTREVGVDTLAPILESLRAQKPEHVLTWFERFKRWLRSLLEQRQNDPDNWLSRWLEDVNVSAAVVRWILTAVIIVLMVMAIAVMYNELRVAGLLRKRPVVDDAAVAATAIAGGDSSGDANFDSLAADRKAPVLLRMLVATLVRSGRLRTERSLTYRELCARATFDDTRQLDCFRRVAALAERTVYASGEVPAEELEPVVAAGRALDAQLRGTPA